MGNAHLNVGTLLTAPTNKFNEFSRFHLAHSPLPGGGLAINGLLGKRFPKVAIDVVGVAAC